MTDHTPTPEDRLNLAAMLRAAADDELCSFDERRLEAHLEEHPEDVARIKAEQELRAAVGRVMGVDSGEGAPAGFRDRVASAMAAVELDTADAPSVPEQMSQSTRAASYWAGSPSRYAAAAAVVLIAAVVVWFNITGPTGFDQTIMDRTSAATFVAREHGNCITNAARAERKFTIENPEDLPAFAGEVVGMEVSLADLVVGGASNINFIDAGLCGVPGGKSVHMRFSLPDYENDISLFMQRDTGRLGLDDGVTYELDTTEDAPNSPNVYIWLREGLVYYLVIETQEGTETIHRSLAVPAEMRQLAGAV
ncbi:MAG: hypothetical protein COB69_08395 [Phycisphaera sp.]|nr:MAG: hypothetical protein COB69_08395 [Phycisphaera sp.]